MFSARGASAWRLQAAGGVAGESARRGGSAARGQPPAESLGSLEPQAPGSEFWITVPRGPGRTKGAGQTLGRTVDKMEGNQLNLYAP